MKNFRHLTRLEKREIYVGYLSDEPKLRIARRLGIDNSTVHYHINKIKHLPEDEIFALFTPKCADGHTSFTCLVCGRAHDNIKNEEFQLIRRLRKQVETLEAQISNHENITHSNSIGPIITVRL